MADHNTTQTVPLPHGEAVNFESLYLKKDFQGAATFLLQHKSQYTPGLFHYNLGTVYLKLEDPAIARYHFELAIKEGFLTNATLNNLNYSKIKLAVDDLTTSEVALDQWVGHLVSIPAPLYTTASLLLLIVMMIFLRLKRNFLRLIPIAIIALIVSLPLLLYFTYVKELNCAITLKDVTIYEGPSKIFSEKGVAKAGSKVVIGSIKEGWFYIKHPQSLVGWVNKDHLGLL